MTEQEVEAFEALVGEAVRDAQVAANVFKDALAETQAILDKLAEIQSPKELEEFLEGRCKANTLAYTLVTLVAPLKGIKGGMKPKHALAMFEAAERCEQDASVIERQIFWQQLVDRVGRENLIEQLLNVAAARKAGKPN